MNVEVVVAIIAGVAAIAAAVGPAWMVRRRDQRTSNIIGDPNGHGTIFEMMTELLHLTRNVDEASRRNSARILNVENQVEQLHLEHAELRSLVTQHRPPGKEQKP